MVRMWGLNPSLLDNRRLLGQHVELHILTNLHIRRLEIARDQGVPPEDIDWTGIKMGWRTHPQFTWWFGKVGAVIEFHEIVVNEMARRKWEKESPDMSYADFRKSHYSHPSPVLSQWKKLALLDPKDQTYGDFYIICAAYPERVIRDLRHLIEKWTKEELSGRPPKHHQPDKAMNLLRDLASSKEEYTAWLEEKLLT